MRYLCLIYADPSLDLSEADQKAEMDGYWAFEAEMRQKRGIVQAGEALQPTDTATTVRVRDGEVLTTDGPFAETKEILGGFYMIDVRDLDEALEVAAKIPTATHGAIEVRPIMEFSPPEEA